MKILRLLILTIFLGSFLLFLPKLFNVKAATMLFNPPFGDVKQGQDLNVDVVINGNGELIDGVDSLVNYDVNILQLKNIKNGPFFSQYPYKKDNGGQIKITALAPKDGVKIFGDIIVVTLDFTVLDNGQTKLNFAFQQGSTTDSNIVLHGTSSDTLSSVTSGTYNVTATPEQIQKTKAKKAFAPPSPIFFFLFVLILIGVGFWYYLRKRKPKEDVFVPEPFPMDEPPRNL